MIDADAFVDLRQVENGLRRMEMAGMDLRPLFNRVRKILRLDQREHAKQERGSSGPWAPLASSTIEHRKARKGKQGRPRRRPIHTYTVKKLGRLPRSFKIKVTPHSIKAESTISWSGAHQPKRGDSTVVGHGARLKAREFLWASTKLLQTVSRLAVDYLVGAWERS